MRAADYLTYRDVGTRDAKIAKHSHDVTSNSVMDRDLAYPTDFDGRPVNEQLRMQGGRVAPSSRRSPVTQDIFRSDPSSSPSYAPQEMHDGSRQPPEIARRGSLPIIGPSRRLPLPSASARCTHSTRHHPYSWHKSFSTSANTPRSSPSSPRVRPTLMSVVGRVGGAVTGPAAEGSYSSGGKVEGVLEAGHKMRLENLMVRQ